MGVFGIIIAALVNMFLQSGALQFAISVIGVLVFAGLTAYDTQRIKDSYYEVAATRRRPPRPPSWARSTSTSTSSTCSSAAALFGNRQNQLIAGQTTKEKAPGEPGAFLWGEVAQLPGSLARSASRLAATVSLESVSRSRRWPRPP